MSYTILSDPPIITTPLSYYVRQPFDISFGSTFSLYPSSIQFTDSASLLLSNTISNKFISANGLATKGNVGNLVVDAISFISPNVSTIVPKIAPNSAYAAVVADGAGNIYFADANNNRIYKSDTSGTYTLYAGTGASGFTNGFRTSATFTSPIGLAIDPSGNLYVSELFDVRKIDVCGNVTALAGSSVQGAVDGIGAAARFMYPDALYIDPSNANTLYVVDSDAHAIRAINVNTSNVTTYAGTLGSAGFVNGPVGTAKFFYPRQIAFRPSGAMFVSDSYNHVIRKIEGGSVSTYAGNGSNNPSNNGSLTTGSFSFPSPMAYDVSSDSLYVFQELNQTIKRVTTTAISNFVGISGVYGSTNGNSSVATFDRVQELTSYDGSLYAPEVSGNFRKIVIPLTVEDARPSGSRPAGYTIVATSTIPVQILSRIDSCTNAIGGAYQINTYAPFGGNTYFTKTGDSLQYTNSSIELLSFLSNIDTSTVAFSSATGFRQAYNYSLNLVVDALSNSSIVDTLSNTVTVNAAGFDTNGISNFTFYKNQPIGNYSFTSAIPVQQPIISPSLPTGLSLVQQDAVGLLFYLTGTPIVQVPTSNYIILARGRVDTTRIITTTISIRVLNEQLLLDISGSSNVQMITNSAITDRIITAAAPPYPLSGNRIRYNWTPALPDGLVFKDINGTSYTTPFVAPDSSSTIVLTGTPTSNAVINASSSNITTTLTASRIASPVISNALNLNFQFSEQVLFRTPNIQSNFYTGLPIVGNQFSNSFSAYTKFADASINAIYSPNLRSDLSLSFVFSNQRADLSGTPLSTGSGSFTVIARNTNNVTGSYDISYSIVNDTISFQSPTPAVDTCLNYIVGRSSSNTKDGYYSYPIRFKATAASGCNVVLLANDLSGSGLSLSNIGSNTYEITGIPFVVRSLSTLTVDASSLFTNATQSTSIKYAILPDVFYFPTKSFTFIQNRAITPYKFDVSTLSERSVVGFTAFNLPTGVSLSAVGNLTGTPIGTTDGSFTVVASTGYASGSNQYGYDIIPDTMLLLTDPLSYTYSPGANVNIDVIGLTYSGRTVSNYAFSNFTPSYGLSINSITGNISGTLSDSIPPNPVLPATCNFFVNASAGTLDGSLSAVFNTTNPIVLRTFTFSGSELSMSKGFYSDSNVLSWQPLSNIGGVVTDAKIKNTTVDSNVFLLAIPNSNTIYRSTDGVTFAQTRLVNADVLYPKPYQLANVPGTADWYAIGVMQSSEFGIAIPHIIRSTDDGLNWDLSGATPLARNIFEDFGPRYYTPQAGLDQFYTRNGLALAYKDGVFLAGGGKYNTGDTNAIMKRSVDSITWSDIATGIREEVAYFNTDNSNVWVVTGSDDNTTGIPFYGVTNCNSTCIKYSTDQGLTWSAVTGGFNVNGYNIAYGSNTWVACGRSYVTTPTTGFIPELRYSTDGSNWSVADLSSTALFTPNADPDYYQPESSNWGIGPIMFDGSNWNVLVHRMEPPMLGTLQTTMFVHSASTALNDGNWQEVGIAGDFVISNTPMSVLTRPQYVRTGVPTSVTFTFNSLPPNGPVFTAPTQTSYILYQFMRITPITFNATGVGTVYYLLNTDDLPLGLSFDPIAQTITGTPMQTGDNSITLYAKDSIGVTKLVLHTTTIIPRIVKNQTSAGAFTSLIRQYTEVNAAQNARDRRVLPTENKNLGEFQSPYKPDATTQSNCPICEP